MNRLGILDWGIGGVSIYKLLKEHLVVPVVYFSDTGVTPYGKMTRSELVARLNAVISYLGSHGVTHLIIGCNAASTALPYLKDQAIKTEGVIESAVAEVVKIKPKHLGLIGGRRTVLSGVYRKAFAEKGIKVRQRIAQPLSGMIESGDVSSQKLRGEARRILGPLRNCSHILLACTHYPAITPILVDAVSPETKLIDPAGALLQKISRWDLEPGDEDQFLTSGDVDQMKMAAKKAFEVKIQTASNVQF